MTKEILKRLKFSTKDSDYILLLIQEHMYKIEDVKRKASLRSFIMRLGIENIEDWLTLREADLRAGKTHDIEEHIIDARKKLFSIVNESPEILNKDFLAVNGKEIMEYYGLKEGKAVGLIKDYFLTSVLGGMSLNTKEKIFCILTKEKLGIFLTKKGMSKEERKQNRR